MSQVDNLLHNFSYLTQMSQDIGIAIGIFLVLGGLFKAKKHGEQKAAGGGGGGVGSIVILLVSGAALIALPSILRVTLMSFWGTNNPLQYSVGGSEIGDMMKPVVMFIRILGIIAFIRGVMMLSKHGEQNQPGHMGKAILHLLSGILCVHVLGTSELLRQFMGFI